MLVVPKRFIKGSDCELDIIFVSHGTHGKHGINMFTSYGFFILDSRFFSYAKKSALRMIRIVIRRFYDEQMLVC